MSYQVSYLDVGVAFKKIRHKKNLTIEQLALDIGTTSHIIRRMEKGLIRGVPLGKVFDLCTFYEIKMVFNFPDNIQDLI